MKTVNISDMSFSYIKGITILNEINLNIEQGEKVGVIGANGAGKSTLLRLICGLETEYEGEISVANLEVTKKNLKEIRKNIGYVFQDSDAQMFLTTVKDNIEFGPKNYGMTKQETDEAVDRALNSVGIPGLKDTPVYMLSGGEKKLASIATVLSLDPDILILDEPSVALDPKNRRRLINVINGMDKTMIVASHDLDYIFDTCDRVILLYNHRIEADGKPEDILTDKELLQRCGLELPLSFSRR